jgi:hypothetical protein
MLTVKVLVTTKGSFMAMLSVVVVLIVVGLLQQTSFARGVEDALFHSKQKLSLTFTCCHTVKNTPSHFINVSFVIALSVVRET